MTEPGAVVAEHLPFMKYGIWQSKQSDPVELVFHGAGTFGAYFSDVDRYAVSAAEGVQSACLWCGQLRVRLRPDAEPHTIAKVIVDMLLSIRCLNAGVDIPERFDTPDIFRT